MVYTITVKRESHGSYATVKKNGKTIECLDGLFVDEQDERDMRELLSLANKAARRSKDEQ